MTAAYIRKVLGIMVIMIVLICGKAIAGIAQAHTWVSVILLVCAVYYVAWGMFWQGDNA